MKTSLSLMLVFSGLVAACGDESPSAPVDAGNPADAIPSAQRYLPLATGAVWAWHVTPTDGTPAYDKTSTVEAFEPAGGEAGATMSFRVHTVGNDGDTVSWQEDTGAAIRRLREKSYSPTQTLLSDQQYLPYKLRLDESNARLVVGTSYTETYTEKETDPTTGATMTTAKSETWTVEAVDESVTVPAGTYSCLRVHRVGTDVGASDKRFWFAKGVGKIKESGNQTEELSSYTAP